MCCKGRVIFGPDYDINMGVWNVNLPNAWIGYESKN